MKGRIAAAVYRIELRISTARWVSKVLKMLILYNWLGDVRPTQKWPLFLGNTTPPDTLHSSLGPCIRVQVDWFSRFVGLVGDGLVTPLQHVKAKATRRATSAGW